jgi:hypothetical protein
MKQRQGCMEVDPEMHSNQNGIRSYKISLYKKTNIIQNMTKNIPF